MTVQMNSAANCINYAGATAPSYTNLMGDSYLLIDYVYLDSEERKRFAQASHEYLIEQLQFTGSESLTASSNKYRLNFNHPCKYLVWVPHLDKYANQRKFVAYATDSDWAAAKVNFCKLVWLAARVNAATTVPLVDASGNDDDVVVPAVAVSGCKLATVAAKVSAKLIALTTGTGNQTASVNDVVLVNNTVTMEDMSNTITELLAGGTGTTNAALFLAANGVNVIAPFNYGNFIDGSDNPVVSAKLQLNGHDRFQARDGNYFNYVQPWQHFSNTPADGVNVYSFALKAEDHQPTGTCNFSRIDNATLQVDVGKYNNTQSSELLGSQSVVNIYTQNYNVLRVMSGMAGTAYSN